jgi:hypothetical protein
MSSTTGQSRLATDDEGLPLIIEYEGGRYSYDAEDLDVEQALLIEKHIDGPMLDYEKGLLVGSAKCMQALGWLILHGGDRDFPIAEVNFKFKRLSDAFGAASEKEAAAEAEAIAKNAAPVDPTGAASLPGPESTTG